MISPRLDAWWHTELLVSQWAVQSRLRSNDGPDVMDYVACEAGMEPGGMLGAGGGSGDERATMHVRLHVPLTLSFK